jgi:hypothetical protein
MAWRQGNLTAKERKDRKEQYVLLAEAFLRSRRSFAVNQFDHEM